jgi:hypothetical protein
MLFYRQMFRRSRVFAGFCKRFFFASTAHRKRWREYAGKLPRDSAAARRAVLIETTAPKNIAFWRTLHTTRGPHKCAKTR